MWSHCKCVGASNHPLSRPAPHFRYFVPWPLIRNSGGENISSIEVESALHQHEAVLHVAVVALPDSFWGETPVAVIETKPGAKVIVKVATRHGVGRISVLARREGYS